MLTLFSLVFTSAPAASSALTTSKWPFSRARRSDVYPPCGAGQRQGQRLPPLSSRGPPACPHHHTPSVALKPGPCLTPFTRLPPAPRLARASLPACTAAAASTRRCRPLTRVCTRARLSVRASERSKPLALRSACPNIRRSQPSSRPEYKGPR
jgi:hypothetical protein